MPPFLISVEEAYEKSSEIVNELLIRVVNDLCKQPIPDELEDVVIYCQLTGNSIDCKFENWKKLEIFLRQTDWVKQLEAEFKKNPSLRKNIGFGVLRITLKVAVKDLATLGLSKYVPDKDKNPVEGEFSLILPKGEDKSVEKQIQIYRKRLLVQKRKAEPQNQPTRFPLSPEAIRFNVPYIRNSYFSGREDVIDQLYESLISDERVAITQTQVISGLGGIGKTQTAVEYAYRYYNGVKAPKVYEYVFWVNADTEITLTTEFSEIATQLALPIENISEQERIILEVQRWFSSHSDWLLVFDNADTPSLLLPLIPKNVSGHILITSRTSDFDCLSIRSPIFLDVFTTKAGVEMLFTRIGRDQKVAEPSELEAATELTGELGGLPLALEQAGAYIKNNSSIQSYLNVYRRRGLSMLDKAEPKTGQYQSSVLLTWVINFEAVEAESPTSAELLRLSSFLAPTEISYNIPFVGMSDLAKRLEESLEREDEDRLYVSREWYIAVEELLEPLERYSLVTRNNLDYRVHRLVQAVVRDSLDEENRLSWLRRAIDATVFTYRGSGCSENFLLYSNLFNQWLTLIDHAEKRKFESKSFAALLSYAGRFHSECSRYEEAELLLKQALEMSVRQFDSENRVQITSLKSLSMLYENQERYQEAESFYKQYLEVAERLFDDEDPEIATIIDDLGNFYCRQGDFDKAEPLVKQALDIRLELLGEEDADFVSSLDSLASLHFRKKDYSLAEFLYEQVYVKRTDIFGDKDLLVAESIENLGNVYFELEDYERAVGAFVRAFGMKRDLLGNEHPDVVRSVDLLAASLLEVGEDKSIDIEEIEKMYRDALNIRLKIFGGDHPDVVISLNNLADFYFNQERYDEVEPLLQQALEMRIRLLGEEHPDVADSLVNLAMTCCVLEHRSDAAPLYEQALEITRKSLGEKHVRIAFIMHNLALSYANQELYDQAECLLRKTLDMKLELLGEDHPDVEDSLGALVHIFTIQGDLKKAADVRDEYTRAFEKKQEMRESPDLSEVGEIEPVEKKYRDALNLMLKEYGGDHPDIVVGLNNLAAFYLNQGRHEEAKPLLERALEMRVSLLGKEHPDVTGNLVNLAEACYDLEHYSDAVSHYEQALELIRKSLGEKHVLIAFIMRNLAGAYANQELYDQAECLLRKTLDMKIELLGEEHPDVADSLGDLVRIFTMQGDFNKSAEVLDEYPRVFENIQKMRESDET